MNIALFTWDNVSWVSQLFLVIFAGVALVSGTVVNKRQARQLIQLETKLEEQREKTALAEKSLLDLQKLIREGREIDNKLATEILERGQKGEAEIMVSSTDEEANNFAVKIAELLRRTGWKVEEGPPSLIFEPTVGVAIEFNRAGWNNELPINSPILERLREPAKTLFKVFDQAATGNQKIGCRTDDSLPSNTFRIVVGPKF